MKKLIKVTDCPLDATNTSKHFFDWSINKILSSDWLIKTFVTSSCTLSAQ